MGEFDHPFRRTKSAVEKRVSARGFVRGRVIERAGRFSPLMLWAIVCLSAIAAADSPLSAADVTFRHDVMAVLSKAGCNRGVCHGNQNGKGGFKLSLRGENPQRDFESLSREQAGRRANPLDPARSLCLLKPTMQVPHEGGRRFALDSLEYRILEEWIAAGMPADRADLPRLERLEVEPTERVLIEPEHDVRLSAAAVFSDGTRRDVTRLAVFEPANSLVSVSDDGVVARLDFGETTVVARYLDRQVAVRLAFVPASPNFAWSGPEPANDVDRLVFDKLRAVRVNPSSDAGDTVFVRRAYLDLLGLVPTADEARRFVQSTAADKRARLIDELLDRPEFADCWAQKWSDLLRNEEKTLDRKGVRNFHAWIRACIADGVGIDQFARELVAARGSTYTNPPANYYRALRDPVSRAEATAQVFLGVRLQCAKCHNHPFDRWTQDDYYGWAALFSRIDYKILANRRLDQNDKHEFDGEQIVLLASKGEVVHPGTGRPAAPRFLGANEAKFDVEGDRLRQTAEWIASPANERFVGMQANRIWYHLMGRGIVDPIDDFRATNPAANPPLLEMLGHELVKSGFDLRHMIRLIMNSRTYQLSAAPNDTNRDDELNFARARIRRVSAEPLLDSLSRVLEAPVQFNGYPLGTRAGEIPGVAAIRPRDRRPSEADQFLRLFGRPGRLQSCECERTDESTLSQAFQLVSGPLLNDMLTRSENRLGRLLAKKRPPREIVEELYWGALSRAPGPEELSAAVEHLQSAANPRPALEDVAWALLTSDEFLLRR